METRERERASRASSSSGRKEEFPLASDCLTCKNVAFVAGPHSSLFFFSFFWQALCDQLSPFPPFSLSLFLCRFTCLLPAQFLWILHSYSHCRQTQTLDWFSICSPYRQVVFNSSPMFSHKFQRKGPKVVVVGGGEGLVNRAWESISLVHVTASRPTPTHPATQPPFLGSLVIA